MFVSLARCVSLRYKKFKNVCLKLWNVESWKLLMSSDMKPRQTNLQPQKRSNLFSPVDERRPEMLWWCTESDLRALAIYLYLRSFKLHINTSDFRNEYVKIKYKPVSTTWKIVSGRRMYKEFWFISNLAAAMVGMQIHHRGGWVKWGFAAFVCLFVYCSSWFTAN